jgi:hypothetical protein
MNVLFPLLETFIAALFVFMVGGIAMVGAAGLFVAALLFVIKKIEGFIRK